MKVHELLDQKSKWCQGVMAIKPDGTLLCNASNHTQAEAWCVLGAIAKCYPAIEVTNMIARLREHLGLGLSTTITAWNDSTTYENVRATLLKLDI